jgi:hypothetical protein
MNLLQLFADAAATTSQGEAQQTNEQAEQTNGTEQPGSEKERKYSDEDVNKLIDQKFAEWQKKQQKAVDEAKRLAEMNATQKAEYERDALKKKLEELEHNNTLFEMSKTARTMLNDHKINIGDDLLTMLVSDDADKTKANVESFSTMFEAAVKQAVTDALRGAPPKAGSNSSVTKEQIMAVKDRAERQKLINENIKLFTGGQT